MLNVSQLRELVIKPALHDLIMASPAAEELMIFTCANESFGGTYLKQKNGPALGIYQMEPETYNDIWQNYIKKKGSLLLIMISSFESTFIPDERRLIYDLRFATAMCRLHYARMPQNLPEANDINGLWEYYKHYYNSDLGAASKDDAIGKYHLFSKYN